MKSAKKYLVLMLSLALLFLVGCGDSKEAPPDKSAKAFYDLYVLQDSTEIEKLGLSKTEVETAIKGQKTATKIATKNNFIANSLTVTDDQLESIYNAQVSILKKLNLKVEVISTEDDTAKVKMSTTYADFMAADEKAAKDTIAEAQSAGISDLGKISEIYVNQIVEEFNAIQPSTETKEATFDFKKDTTSVDGKEKEIWVPTDMTAFGTELGKMITGQ